MAQADAKATLIAAALTTAAAISMSSWNEENHVKAIEEANTEPELINILVKILEWMEDAGKDRAAALVASRIVMATVAPKYKFVQLYLNCRKILIWWFFLIVIWKLSLRSINDFYTS